MALKISKRDTWSHQGQNGSVLIIAGSSAYTGSPIFNAMGALRTGADLTNIITHKRAADVCANYSPDIITTPLSSDLSTTHVNKIVKMSDDFDSVLIGGGLIRNKKTHQTIRKIISKIDKPMVIDAEAIYAVAEDNECLKGKTAILTPHMEEFGVLSGKAVKDEVKDRKDKVKKLAFRMGMTILLKGSVDVVSNGYKAKIIRNGSPFMTVAGTGDTLAGIIAGLLAQKLEPLDAAYFGAEINGHAGKMVAKENGPGMLASDMLDYISDGVIKYL